MDTLRDDYAICPHCDRYIPKDDEGLRQHAIHCTTRLIIGESVESFLEDLARGIKNDK